MKKTCKNCGKIIENCYNSQKYCQEHKEELKKYRQEYNQNHKEEIKANRKKYRQEHKEELKKYRQEHKYKDKKNCMDCGRKISNYAKRCRFCNKQLILPKKKIINMYEKENISGRIIAKQFKCSPPTIYKMLKENNVLIKGSSFFSKGRKHTKEWKRNMHEKMKGRKMSKAWRKKISDKLKGRTLSKESKIKRSASLQGIPLSEWKGFVSFEPYGAEFNNKFKRAIRKRDNQICMLCGIHREKLNEALDVHHTNYNKLMSTPQNCVSLCKSCHMKTNYDREIWTKFFQSLLNKKYGYQYSQEGEIVLNIK